MCRSILNRHQEGSGDLDTWMYTSSLCWEKQETCRMHNVFGKCYLFSVNYFTRKQHTVTKSKKYWQAIVQIKWQLSFRMEILTSFKRAMKTSYLHQVSSTTIKKLLQINDLIGSGISWCFYSMTITISTFPMDFCRFGHNSWDWALSR